MKRVFIGMLVVLALSSAMLASAVSTTSIGASYTFGYLDQDAQTYSGTSIGVNLRRSNFRATDKLGLRWDLSASKSLKLKENDAPATNIKGFDVDVGVALAYQQRLTYLSFVEAGLGLQALGTSKQYTASESRRVNQHILLGIAAFLDYHYALQNKLALTVGANAKMPLVGFARYGAKDTPQTGRISTKGLEIFPYVGITFIL